MATTQLSEGELLNKTFHELYLYLCDNHSELTTVEAVNTVLHWGKLHPESFIDPEIKKKITDLFRIANIPDDLWSMMHDSKVFDGNMMSTNLFRGIFLKVLTFQDLYHLLSENYFQVNDVGVIEKVLHWRKVRPASAIDEETIKKITGLINLNNVPFTMLNMMCESELFDTEMVSVFLLGKMLIGERKN